MSCVRPRIKVQKFLYKKMVTNSQCKYKTRFTTRLCVCSIHSDCLTLLLIFAGSLLLLGSYCWCCASLIHTHTHTISRSTHLNTQHKPQSKNVKQSMRATVRDRKDGIDFSLKFLHVWMCVCLCLSPSLFWFLHFPSFSECLSHRQTALQHHFNSKTFWLLGGCVRAFLYVWMAARVNSTALRLTACHFLTCFISVFFLQPVRAMRMFVLILLLSLSRFMLVLVLVWAKLSE